MSLTPFDWSKLIVDLTDETFGIPPDVIFQIVENDQVHEIMAHKTIFAMISPFFKTMFYSMVAGDKTAKVFKIEKTTAPAFRIIKDAIYNNKSIGDSLQGKSVDEVFHVVELIERLQIKELMEVMNEYLANFPITDVSVLEVAEEAMEYSGLFKAESDKLLVTCAQFLTPKLKDVKSMTRYAKENKDRKEVFGTLFALMDDIIPTECPNRKKEVCQDGQVVTSGRNFSDTSSFKSGKVSETSSFKSAQSGVASSQNSSVRSGKYEEVLERIRNNKGKKSNYLFSIAQKKTEP